MVCAFAAILFLLLGPRLSYCYPDLRQQVLAPSAPNWGNPPIQKDKWNVLYHQGGNGPWIQKVDGVLDGGIELPSGCKVDMVHGMSRHGERYPTIAVGYRMIALVTRLQLSAKPYTGDLAFLNTWKFFTTTPDSHFEQLTSTGPYAGVLESFATGVKLRTRYQHLWSDKTPGPTYVFAGDDHRVVDTARHFAAGFFGLAHPNASVQIIPETFSQGADTLTPGKTCLANLEDAERGRLNGYLKLQTYREHYLPALRDRLHTQNPHLSLAADEVYSMQEMCGFETTVRGDSPWCDVFTPAEWRQYEYARDLIHFYRSGPGNQYSRVMGGLWLNATTQLLLDGPKRRGPVFFSFAHDGDMVPMLAALGLFGTETELSDVEEVRGRRWKTSDVTPMGGRVLFERLSCANEKKYVRINVNDGIVALEGCQSGPGGSCPMTEFAGYIRRRQEEAGDFKEMCGIDAEGPEGLTFLRQPGFETDQSGDAGGDEVREQ